MTRGFESVCTNDEARDYFKKCGLTYNNITEGDILSLVLMINRELKKVKQAWRNIYKYNVFKQEG